VSDLSGSPVARASPGRRKLESLSVLAALVAGQLILEPIIIGFVGVKDMGSELQTVAPSRVPAAISIS
jgi:hypothetical protein